MPGTGRPSATEIVEKSSRAQEGYFQRRPPRQLAKALPTTEMRTAFATLRSDLPGRRSPSDRSWWAVTGSNRRHPRCKRGALPAELTALIQTGGLLTRRPELLVSQDADGIKPKKKTGRRLATGLFLAETPSLVDGVLEALACPELGLVGSGDLDGFAGPRVTPRGSPATRWQRCRTRPDALHCRPSATR